MAKYKIIPSSRTIVHSPISIGHKAEKGVEAIEFDLTAWVETYGSGTLTVIMRRWGDAIPYPIALEIGEDNKATWTLSDIDTAKAGMAYAQLNYIVGDEVVKKSDIYTFRVMGSLTGEGEPPEAYESWLEHLTHLAAEAMAEVLDIEGIVTDKTLTVDGGIADAKAAGDALALKADKSTTYTKTEVDQMIEDVEVETDTTLSVSGAPADAKKTGDELSALKADLGAYVFGENLISMPASGKTHNGITFSVSGSTIVANGTASSNAYIDVCKFTPETNGLYTLNGSPSGGGNGKYILYIANTDNYDTGNGATYTLTAGVEYTVRIIVYNGHVASNLTFTPVLIYNETGNGALNAVKTELSDKVSGVKGNNIFSIPDYEGSPNGMKISIKNNRITLKGTNTTAIRLKLTHGIDVKNTEQDSWASESLSDVFEVGKQYCLAYKVYSGTLSNTIGTPARVSKSPSVSFLSGSVPKNIATAENMPKYIMLYIPINTTADVTFEPFFMEAFTQNDMFSYDVSEDVKITSKKTPKNQYNYFTVSVNTSTDDSVESVQTVNAVVTFPESYKAQGEKTPLIMYCHGRTDTVSVGDWVENDTKRKTLIESFVSGGYAVFDVDAISHPSGGAVDVGSPALMQAYIKAWEYIRTNYNVEDKLFIYSLSFGTFVALNMLSWYPTAIKTACLSAIRASHRAVFDRGTPYNAEIAVNFGFNDSTGATYEADKMLGFDPYADISDGKLIKSIPPIKVFTSSGDTLELTEAHTLISAWKAGGNFINYKEVSGLNHSDMCYLADAGLRSEVVSWFNRYR